jgi:predicted HD superfamily hydrolase involved in NAD metabolism
MSSLPATDLTGQLAQYLSPKRIEHCRSVARVAVELARRYAPQLERQAELAGLLHDNAKRMEPAELLRRAEALGLPISSVERDHPALLHGQVGAALLPERFGVDDPDVAQAVIDHVTGRSGMGLLSRILYVADQAADDRDFAGVDELRHVMHEDLEAAVLLVAMHKIDFSLRKHGPLEPKTVELYNALVRARGVHGAD